MSVPVRLIRHACASLVLPWSASCGTPITLGSPCNHDDGLLGLDGNVEEALGLQPADADDVDPILDGELAMSIEVRSLHDQLVGRALDQGDPFGQH